MLPLLRVLLLSLAAVMPVAAQHHPAADTAARDSVSAMLTLVATRVTPALAGRARNELLVTQPMVVLRGSPGISSLRHSVMVDFERWTMPDGEPVAGIWGEGFIDRRHPHTVLHELMLSASRRVGRAQVSVAAGKGFVPFGTDDPMVRPFTKYPANHHIAQVMERVQLVGAFRFGPRFAFEGAVFNGDEPQSSTAPPQWSRFGDSHALRVTAWPVPSLELQASRAAVRSPEFVRAEGLDHGKLSTSARWTPHSGSLQYLFTEWGRTTERYEGRSLFSYATILMETVVLRGAWTLALRGEQTSRPEEERLLDPFRTQRPPNHLVLQGITRWRLASLQVARAVPGLAGLRLNAFTEVTRAWSAPRFRPALLDPRDISGSDRAWQFTLGMRAGLGAMPARVGRYGVAAGSSHTVRMLGMPDHQ